MAIDVDPGPTLKKSIGWLQGFALFGLVLPGYLYPSLGSSIVALGAIGAVVVWGMSSIIGAFQAGVISEVSTMYPDTAGIGVLAHRGIGRYVPWAGAVGTFGNWVGWSVSMSVNALLAADYFKVWDPHLNAQIIASVILLAAYVANVFGLKQGVVAGWVLGLMTVVPMALMIIGGLLTGHFSAHNLLPAALPGHVAWFSMSGLGLIWVWMFIAGWSAYGSDPAATLAPEFRDTVHDVPRALTATVSLALVFYVLMPIVSVGVLGVHTISQNPYTAFVPLLSKIFGPVATDIVMVSIIGSFLLTVNLSTIDGSRVLRQMSKDHLTIKWFEHLNNRGIPTHGMLLDLLFNLFLVWFLANPIVILVAGNIGYMLSFTLVVLAFLLLRKDEPKHARPIKLKSYWKGIAWVIVVLNTTFIIFGAPSYGMGAVIVGLVILAISVVAWYWRQRVDRQEKYVVAPSKSG